MEREKFKQLLDGYVAGTLNDEELRLFQQWFESFGESEIGIPEFADNQKASDLENELKGRVFLQTIAKPANQPIIRKLFTWTRMVAALLLIATGFILFLNLSRSNRSLTLQTQQAYSKDRLITTGVGQIKKIQLTDGSTVHLNSNSVLQIPGRFAQSNRTLVLKEGEAFFQVSKDRHHPFIVKTSSLNVRVLGTAFNISSYKVAQNVNIQVSHGKVQVSNLKYSVLGVLTRNQTIQYNKSDGKSKIIVNDTYYANSWINGSVYLIQASFNELALNMKNMYGVDLVSKRNEINKNSYNLTLSRERSLEETLRVICRIQNKSYRRSGNEIEIY
jgi:transmembrane sensor